jgi:hypothetical protein
MTLRPALLAAAALAAALAALALCRWGDRGNRDPVSLAWEVRRADELAPLSRRAGAATRPSGRWRPRWWPEG